MRECRRRLRATWIRFVLLVAIATGGAGNAFAHNEKDGPEADSASHGDVTAPDPGASTGQADADFEIPGGTPGVPPPLMPRGLVKNQPAVTPGYTLFNPLLSDTTYLVNNDGAIVHLWKSAYSPGGGMYLLPNGHLLRPGRDPAMLGFRAGGTGGILQELAWDGTVVWEWRLSDAQHVQHHDIEPLPNGNLLAIAWEVKSAKEARLAGRRTDQIPDQGLWPDWVLEIEPLRPHRAKIVWEWHVWDHLIQNQDSEKTGYGDPAESPERLDINAGVGAEPVDATELAQLQALGYVPADAKPEDLASDFLHVNAISYHPRLDQIALSVPELAEIWIIDHSTTTSEAAGSTGGRAGQGGDLLYRWGNPAAYGRRRLRHTSDAQRFFYQHDVRWIPDGWKGAGNLTVFNNGRDRPAGPWSSVVEWTPPLGSNGRYVLPERANELAPWGPEGFAWEFRAGKRASFYAPFISGAQRLENGNTLVCDGTGGRFLEVTEAGRVVWEYRNPFSGEVRNEDGSPPQPGLEDSPYAVFRATRIPVDHPAVEGRDLQPLEPAPPWFEPQASAQ